MTTAIRFGTLRVPLARDLTRCHVEAVIEVEDRGIEREPRETRLVVVARSPGPDVVRNSIVLVGEPGDGQAELECGALRV